MAVKTDPILYNPCKTLILNVKRSNVTVSVKSISFMSSFENPPESSSENPEVWYEKAKTKAESFVQTLNPSLRVSIEHVRVNRFDSGEPYQTLSLRFKSDSDPNLDWNLEIGMSDEYINERLEPVVRSLYEKHHVSRRP